MDGQWFNCEGVVSSGIIPAGTKIKFLFKTDLSEVFYDPAKNGTHCYLCGEPIGQHGDGRLCNGCSCLHELR